MNKKGGVKLFLTAIALFVMVAAAFSFAASTDFADRTENPTNEKVRSFNCRGGML